MILRVGTSLRHHVLEANELDGIVGRNLSLTFADLLGSGENTTQTDDDDIKETLLVYWSTECSLCLREIPKLNTLYAEWSGKGAEILGLSQYRRPERVIDIPRRLGIIWPQFPETGEPLGIAGTPSFILLDVEGTTVVAGFNNSEAVLQHFLNGGK